MNITSIVRNILVRVGADIQPLQRTMVQAQSSISGFQTVARTAASHTQLSMSSVVESLTMGRLGLVALGSAAVASFVLVSKHAISSAMDVVESESLFSVSMGNMADSARTWSNDLQDSLGLNAYQVRENVGLFYNMTTSMGLARDQAYQVSTGLTRLAYDMSSFYNQSPDEMFEKLQSGLSGEVEPLKRLGIIVNETTTQNYAYAHGIASVGSQLTETQKVMARYGAIMEQTKNAQGDLARTINSPSNQLRLLQTQLQLASINMGNAFLPMVQLVLPVLVNFAKGLAIVTNTFAQFMSVLFGTNTAQTQNVQSATSAAAAQTSLGKAAKAAGNKAKKGVAGFDQLNILQDNLAASAGDAADVLDSGGGMVPTPAPVKSDTGNVIPQGIIDMANKAKAALAPIGVYISKIGGMLNNFWTEVRPALQPILDFVVKLFKPAWEDMVQILAVIFDKIKDVIGGALHIIKGIIEVFSALLTGNWSTLWQGIKDITSGAWTIIKAIFSGAWSIIQIGWNSFLGALSVVWQTGWNAISNFATGIWVGIKQVWSQASGWFYSNVVSPIQGVFSGLWNGVKNIFTEGSNGVIWALETFLNFAIKGFNKLIYGWNITKSALGVSGWTMPIDEIHIPRLAKGGLVSAPTLAMVGDNKNASMDPEVISPLSKLQSMLDSALSKNGGAGGNSGSGGDIILMVGETELGRVAIKAINSVHRQTGMTLLTI